MPGSRLESHITEFAYGQLGVRIITPDRPGYGLSDPAPRRSLMGWAADVHELVNAMGVGRFGLTSASGGGIYALAVAAAMPERLTGVALASSPGPMDVPGAREHLGLPTSVGLFVADYWRPVFDGVANAMVRVFRRYPKFFLEQTNRGKPRADRTWMATSWVRACAAEEISEGLRGGVKGYVDDIALLARPWPFRPSSIRVPVDIWHGDEDSVIPLRHGIYLSETIPGARLHVCHGEAHMVIFGHLPEMMIAATGGLSRAEAC